jgi:hypothetical protein
VRFLSQSLQKMLMPQVEKMSYKILKSKKAKFLADFQSVEEVAKILRGPRPLHTVYEKKENLIIRALLFRKLFFQNFYATFSADPKSEPNSAIVFFIPKHIF